MVGTADAVDEESFNARRSSAVILTPLDPRSLRVSGFAVFSSGSDASGPQEFAGSLVSRPYVSEGGCPDSLRHDISLSVGHFPPLRTPCTLVPLSGTNRPRCPHSLPQSLQICVSPKKNLKKKRKISPKKRVKSKYYYSTAQRVPEPQKNKYYYSAKYYYSTKYVYLTPPCKTFKMFKTRFLTTLTWGCACGQQSLVSFLSSEAPWESAPG